MSVSIFTQILGVELFPVQRVVLKLLQDEELDHTVADIRVDDSSWLPPGTRLTEAEYLGYLFDDGRSSTAHQQKANEFYLTAGRRSGKTLVGSLNTAYTLADLVNRREELVGDLIGNICLMNIGCNRDLTAISKRLLSGHVSNIGLLRRNLRSNTQNYMRFDVRGESTGHGTVQALYRSSRAMGLRGYNNYMVTIDEAAFINNDYEVYQATKPSLSVTNGKMILISSPHGKSGLFYTKMHRAIECMDDSTVALQIPTWEMNPSITKEQCREVALSDYMFRSEYGAEFLDPQVTK